MRLRRTDARRFQSAPPHGRRLHPLHGGVNTYSRFNPRLRTGGDPPPSGVALCCRWRFNPRLRTGGDLALVAAYLWLIKFQSAPPHGRRLQPAEQAIDPPAVSIRASAREATTPAHQSTP